MKTCWGLWLSARCRFWSSSTFVCSEGEAQAARLRIEALGGQENYLVLKLAETILEQWKGEIPNVLVVGENGANLDTAVLSKLVQRQVQEDKPQAAPAP